MEENNEANVKLFEWKDGPVVEAMKNGSMCLLDEISLAEDSVLERINSVLEPERTLLLAEKSESASLENVDEIVAAHDFRIIATMNPGGDYGKKEVGLVVWNTLVLSVRDIKYNVKNDSVVQVITSLIKCRYCIALVVFCQFPIKTIILHVMYYLVTVMGLL